jgi:hypothetical protein
MTIQTFIILYLLYVLIGIGWGSYAMRQQRQWFPDTSENKITAVFLLNVVVWPIAVVFACFKYWMRPKTQ